MTTPTTNDHLTTINNYLNYYYRPYEFPELTSLDDKNPNFRGYTPLMFAIWHKNHTLAEQLLEYGANPNIRNKYGETALYMAIDGGQTEMVELLLNHGANANTALFGKPLLFEALTQSHPRIIELLIEHGANPTDQDLFFKILTEKNTTAIKYLIEQGANVNRSYDMYGSPLSHAIAHGATLEIVQLLVENGADASLGSPLSFAVRNILDTPEEEQLKIIEYLIECGAEMSPKAYSTPLGELSSSTKSVEYDIAVMELFLKHGRTVNDMITVDRMEAYFLHKPKKAAKKVLIWMLENGLDPNIKDSSRDRQLLHYVVSLHRVALIRLLINNGADVNIPDNYGKNVYYYALYGYTPEWVDRETHTIEENYNDEQRLQKILHILYANEANPHTGDTPTGALTRYAQENKWGQEVIDFLNTIENATQKDDDHDH